MEDALLDFLLRHFSAWTLLVWWFVGSIIMITLMSDRLDTLLIALCLYVLSMWKIFGVI